MAVLLGRPRAQRQRARENGRRRSRDPGARTVTRELVLEFVLHREIAGRSENENARVHIREWRRGRRRGRSLSCREIRATRRGRARLEGRQRSRSDGQRARRTCPARPERDRPRAKGLSARRHDGDGLVRVYQQQRAALAKVPEATRRPVAHPVFFVATNFGTHAPRTRGEAPKAGHDAREIRQIRSYEAIARRRRDEI